MKKNTAPTLSFSGKSFSHQDLLKGNYTAENPFEKQSLDFCRDWLKGQETFSLQTSGSTGKSKIIEVKRSQLVASARATVRSLELSPPLKALLCLNTAFIGGKMMLVRALEWAWDLHIIPPSGQPFRDLPDLDLDFTALVPLQLQSILEDEAHFRDRLEKLRLVIVGGGGISPRLLALIQDLSLAVYSTYGMTETLSHIALRRLNGPRAQDYYQTLEGVEIRLDERNCLAVKAPVSLNQWVQSNDLVELLDAKRFRFRGRVDNVINSGGIKIIPEEEEGNIASVFAKLGFSQAFFLAGLPHPKLGQELSLVIEGEALEKNEEKTLNRELTKNSKLYKNPRKIVYLNKFLRTSTEKIRRKATLKLIKN